MTTTVLDSNAEAKRVLPSKPRLGFLGVGWIGRNRMEAIAQSGCAEITAIADPAPEARRELSARHPETEWTDSLEAMLRLSLDGIVIATPSALHAGQATTALSSGVAVFCQKPLGRNAAETRAVVEAARRSDRLLGVDLSYRFLPQTQRMREIIHAGELGEVYAVEMAFHNGYGPDKPWFYERESAGGGCVLDLGIHLVDLALWILGFPEVIGTTSRLFSNGKPLAGLPKDRVEDYASARIDLASGAAIQLACSWKLPVGRDAVIEASFYGTKGGLALKNVDGSFQHFVAHHYRGTKTELLTAAMENWGPGATLHWTHQLAFGGRFSSAVTEIEQVAETLDAIYRERS